MFEQIRSELVEPLKNKLAEQDNQINNLNIELKKLKDTINDQRIELNATEGNMEASLNVLEDEVNEKDAATKLRISKLEDNLSKN